MIEIALGVGLFSAIVLLLAVAVILARALLMPSGEVRVTVDGEREVRTRAGAKLLDVLLDDGIPIPAACGGVGTCGLCRVTVTAGGGEALPIETARFSRRQLGEGARLACQVTLRCDLEMRLPEELLAVDSWDCIVRSTRTVAPLIQEIVLGLPADARLEFRAGAFVQITAPPHQISFRDFEISARHEAAWSKLELRRLASSSRTPVTRAYSIANTPQERGCIVLLVRLALPPPRSPDLPPGIVSSWLFSLRAGDRVAASGPYGHFGARDGDCEMVVIGGGVGMAPLRAILFDQLERLGTRRKISFWYGARSVDDLFYVDEFDALAKKHENFRWTTALSDPQPGDAWTGETGFIHRVVLERHLGSHPAPEECEYYLCGPPLMIDAVLAMLDELGVDDDQIFHDDFGS